MCCFDEAIHLILPVPRTAVLIPGRFNVATLVVCMLRSSSTIIADGGGGDGGGVGERERGSEPTWENYIRPICCWLSLRLLSPCPPAQSI